MLFYKIQETDAVDVKGREAKQIPVRVCFSTPCWQSSMLRYENAFLNPRCQQGVLKQTRTEVLPTAVL